MTASPRAPSPTCWPTPRDSHGARRGAAHSPSPASMAASSTASEIHRSRAASGPRQEPSTRPTPSPATSPPPASRSSHSPSSSTAIAPAARQKSPPWNASVKPSPLPIESNAQGGFPHCLALINDRYGSATATFARLLPIVEAHPLKLNVEFGYKSAVRLWSIVCAIYGEYYLPCSSYFPPAQ